MGVSSNSLSDMGVTGRFLALALILGVQASPLPISIDAFEDVENEAFGDVEKEVFEDLQNEAFEVEQAGRSGRQLWYSPGHLINPILALNPDGSTVILYQGFGFQPGIIGFPGAGGQGWPGPVQPGGHPGSHPGGWPAAGGSPGGWPGAGGSPAGPGGWPPAIQPAPTHPPAIQPAPAQAPWKPPVTTKPIPPPVAPVVAETPASEGS